MILENKTFQGVPILDRGQHQVSRITHGVSSDVAESSKMLDLHMITVLNDIYLFCHFFTSSFPLYVSV